MLRWRRKSSSSRSAALPIALLSLRATCRAGSSPKKFGNANSSASSRTIPTSMYFQRAYSSISGALERALRHQLQDLHLLHLDAHALGDLQGHEGVADLGDAPEQAPVGHHLIARAQARDQVLVF